MRENIVSKEFCCKVEEKNMAVAVRDFIILLFYSIYFGLFYFILFYFEESY